jgi:hypothetical protein
MVGPGNLYIHKVLALSEVTGPKYEGLKYQNTRSSSLINNIYLLIQNK